MDFTGDLLRFLKYLQFKGECIAYQEANPIRFDKDLADKSLATLYKQKEEKVKALEAVMPKVPEYKTQNKPKVTHKKDGTLSSHGQKWFLFLKEHKLPPTHKDPVKYVSGYKEPNAGSVAQVKEWLFSLDWDPCTFKFVKEGDGSERKIPQVRKDGELTPSVLALVEKVSDLEHLAGLTVIQHRIGVFEGFISNAIEKDGKWYLQATIGGLTNTLRFKHKSPLVNLPGVDKAWGKEIRGCLIADDGEALVGTDMVSLESTTKRHYIYPHDPEYAEEMGKEGFDEHLDLALKNGAITQDQMDHYNACDGVNENDPQYKVIKGIRKDYKPVNYSAVYGVGTPKLSRETGMSRKKAGALLKAYWERNWSVKKIAEEQVTKQHHGYGWLRNPISGFWHELRFDKDRFSTLNQSSGVYLFDSWLVRCASRGYWGNAQFHDETLGRTKDRRKTANIMQEAIEQLNNDISLNVSMGIDTQFGGTYSDVH